LRGTGKTTLSADPSRTLIGDDEHGWAEDSTLSTSKGAATPKVIKLSRDAEPEIYATTERFARCWRTWCTIRDRRARPR